MNPNKEILDLIIPVYREDAIIKQTLNEISLKIKTPHRILIVYEDSADPTLPQVRDYIETESKKNILLIQSSQRKGVASAIKTGIHSANLPYVGILMADLSDDFSLVDKMVRKLDEGFDVVCGSRYMPGGKQIGGPLFKKILSYLAGRTLHFLTKIPTYDVTNSFRLYKLNSLKDLDIQETIGFAISLEILVKAVRKFSFSPKTF